jgi:hypothetical protein
MLIIVPVHLSVFGVIRIANLAYSYKGEVFSSVVNRKRLSVILLYLMHTAIQQYSAGPLSDFYRTTRWY